MRGEIARAEVERRIARLATSQRGVVSLAQLRAAGLGEDAVHYRVRLGRLHRLHRGVYAVGHGAVGERGKLVAAVLACGEGAVISHRSAAALWRLRARAPQAVDVTVSSRAGRARRRGLTIHRCRLPAAEITVHDHVPATTPARTLLDLAEIITRRALERTVDEAERLQVCDRAALGRVIQANRGRAGAAMLDRLLEDHRPGSTLTRSKLEELFIALCDSHGVPRPAVNMAIGPFTVDFLWRGERLVAETDGRESHGTSAAFEADWARDAELMVAGYRVVRFTYRQVVTEPAAVARIVKSLLLARAAP